MALCGWCGICVYELLEEGVEPFSAQPFVAILYLNCGVVVILLFVLIYSPSCLIFFSVKGGNTSLKEEAD